MDFLRIIELCAVAFGLIQGVLVMRNRRSNWIFYSLQMLLMIVFSGAKHLFGDVVNSAVYLALGVIGFAIWNKKDPRDIRACGAKERVVYCLVTAAATFLVFLLTKRTDDPLPLLDSFTTVSSFVATYYMITKKIDTWIVWFVNDIFCEKYNGHLSLEQADGIFTASVRLKKETSESG